MLEIRNLERSYIGMWYVKVSKMLNLCNRPLKFYCYRYLLNEDPEIYQSWEILVDNLWNGIETIKNSFFDRIDYFHNIYERFADISTIKKFYATQI